MNRKEQFDRLTDTSGLRGDLRAKSVRAASVTGLVSMGDFALRIGSTAVLARLLTPEHFGLVMMVTAVIGIADQLKELGLSSATVQRREISHEEISNLFWINVGFSALIAVVLCVAAPFISAYYREPRLTVLTCILASTFVLSGLGVQHQALLTRQMRLGQTAVVRFLASLLSTLLAIALAWFDYGYWALIWREVARSALLAAGMWWCLRWVPGLPSFATDVRPLLGFGANLTAANILGAVTGGMDRFFLGRQWGAVSVGVYRQASQLIAAPTDQLLSPLYQVAQPALSLLQTDGSRFLRFYRMLLTLVAGITMPLSLFVVVYAYEITSILLGPEWSACAPLIMILSFGTFIRQSIGSSALILITRGRSRAHLVLSAACNIAAIIGIAVGSYWGALGVATADVIVTYVVIAPRLYFTLKGSPVSFRDFTSACARPAIASIGMAVALWFTRAAFAHSHALLGFILGAILGPVLVIGIWFMLPGGRADLQSLVSDLKTSLFRKSSARMTAPAATNA